MCIIFLRRKSPFNDSSSEIYTIHHQGSLKIVMLSASLGLIEGILLKDFTNGKRVYDKFYKLNTDMSLLKPFGRIGESYYT